MKERGIERFKSTCSYCGVGCGIDVTKKKDGRLEVKGDETYPVNKGMLCSKGMNLHYTVMDQSDRLTSPQLRWSKNHPLENVDWDTAIGRAAAVFKSLIAKYGPDSVGFYISGQCLTEEYYLVNKLVKGYLGTNNIDTNSRLCMSAAVMGYKLTLGEDSVPISYDDIEEADCFLITGANPAWCHPILYRRLEKHKINNPDVKVIVVDPRETDTAINADLHLQINPGTDEVLYRAIAKVLIEQGMVDENFILDHTEGFGPYRKEIMATSLKQASSVCGISVDMMIKAARMIGQSKGYISMWAMGINQSASGVNKNLALLALHLVTGKIGKPGSGPFSLTGQPNAMGGREVGGMATLLAAHKDLKNPEHRREVADFWGVDGINDKPGKTATEMFEALRTGEMKAIWIICTNPSVSMPDARLVDEALSNARFVVVQDISDRSDTARYADLVLPAAGWLEKEGTMTNSERRISYLPKAVSAPGSALPDLEIILRFAKAMGYSGFDFGNAEEVYAEYARMTKGSNIDISGLNYEKLISQRSAQWPVPSTDHAGTSRLFEDGKFYTASGKAQFHVTGPQVETEELSPEFPLILTTGRIRDQWHTMTRTGKVSRLGKHIGKPYLEINPIDATARGIKDGEPVVISSSRGEVRVTAQVTKSIKEGVVFLPMHWGKILNKDTSRANNVTDSRVDPVSKQPGFKYSAVNVAAFEKPQQKIVLVGAGAAAFRFINTFRQSNQTDEIHVFSKEEWPFYNRVLLPEYVNEHKEWKDLLKYHKDELEALDLKLYPSNPIVSVNRENKTLIDEKGETHTYDKLILATGSRAFIPPGVPKDMPGVMAMRNRANADELKQRLSDNSHVLIVGGGLLGLELASSLRDIEVEVTIIQRGSRLMERQLDPMASSLLKEYIEDRLDVRIYTDEEVRSIRQLDNGKLEAIARNDKVIECEAIVYAIGTRPNVELAKEAGLQCHIGVTVDDHMTTSDPDIFALGEIAEHAQKLNGITLAAENQADICARFLLGDPNAIYEGTSPMNILKFPELDLCSIGLAQVPQDGHKYDEILFMDRAELYYKKCIVRDDKLVGAILLGDKAEFAEFKELIDGGTELSDKRLQLLRAGKTSAIVKGELVCSCNSVGSGNIEEAIGEGCDSLQQICDSTGAGLGCGSCKSQLQRILKSSLEPVS
ncbi:MAG: molybdopterin-dependent oxidoreductase [Cyclobacteriaceae bacterium]